MYHIAIVEDSRFDQKQLLEYLHRYEKETNISFQIDTFSDGADLIHNYPAQLDILLMDIVMNKLDGMKTARLVRRRDEKVILIFISSMIQYAIQGYSVDAMDFLVKPVSYMGLKLRLDRALLKLGKNASRHIKVHNADGDHSIPVSDICYLETSHHKVVIHTKNQTIPANCSMRTLEKELADMPFFRCHTAFLVNLKYIDKVQGNDIWVNGQLLSISRYRRKDFLEVWTAYLAD
jgi:DNA-binding LytR/AlgR family response regulator